MKLGSMKAKREPLAVAVQPVVRFRIPPFWKAAGWLVLVAGQFGPPYEVDLWPDRIIDILIRAGIAFIAANYAVGAIVAAFKSITKVHLR